MAGTAGSGHGRSAAGQGRSVAGEGGHEPAAGGDLHDGEQNQRARGAQKDPSEWVTGGEPATGAQESYLSTLAREAGEEVPEGLSKAEASEEIDRLQEETGRGQS